MPSHFTDHCTILRGLVGSTVHGLNLEGSDDRDEMGVCIEPLSEVLTLNSSFEQYIFRSAAERTGIKDARSEAGDLDLTIFSLRKFCKLAASGNPTVLLMFYTPELVVETPIGKELRSMAQYFASKEAGARFLGYMHGQRLRLLGEKGQKRVKRPELEEKYGYDTKYAMHVLRLGFQGLEFLDSGKLTLPMQGSRGYLMGVRQGEESLESVIATAEMLEADLKKALEKSPLPEHPNRPVIESWMQQVYLEQWNKTL